VEIKTPWSWLQTAIYPVSLDDTVNYQVGISANDANETAAGAVSITNTAANADNRDEFHGSRWTGVTIPDGATIDAATVDLSFINSNVDEPDIEMYFEDGSAPGVFTTGADNISNRTATTEKVYLDNADIGIVSDGEFMSVRIALPELKTIVQELEDSYDYSAGSSMVFILRGAVGIVATRDCGNRFYDFAGNTFGAKLYIEYTAGNGGRTTHNTDPYGLGMAIGVSRTFKVHG
jgi:hypothetical protein